MERNREVRRASIVGSNGFSRRRHRTNMLRDSPDEDGRVELQESVRLRDRNMKDRDRERERERERERNLRERSSRTKRKRGERLISNRDDIGGDETSDESLNDDDYEDDGDATATGLVPAAAAISNHSLHSGLSQQYSSNNTNSVINNHHHLQHRKSFPLSSSSKNFRASPIWKPDEIINVSVPRKARSASTKRSHDWTSTSSNNCSGSGGEPVHRQASTSPARQGGVSTLPSSPAAPVSPPSSSNATFRKKLKSGGSNGGQKLKPPKAAAKQSSSNPEELEIEIAEVLYGLMTQSQAPSSKKEDSREVDRSYGDVKSHFSSPISNSDSADQQILGSNSAPPQSVALKKKRQIHENWSCGGSVKLDIDKTSTTEISSPNLEKISTSNGHSEIGGNSASQEPQAAAPPPEPRASASLKINLELKAAAGGLKESRDSAVKKDMNLPKEKNSTAIRYEDSICMGTILTASASSTMITANELVSDVENQRQQKLKIDLMAPPPQVRSSPERETKIHFKATTTAEDKKSSLSICNKELKPDVFKDKMEEKRKIAKEQPENAAVGENMEKWTVQEAGLKKENDNKGRSVVDAQSDLEKPVRNENTTVNLSGNKLQLYNEKQQQQGMPFKVNKEESLSEKSGQSKSALPFPVPMASWPGGLPPMGYMAPLQGVVSMDGSTVAPAPIQPLASQPRPKRCATHSYIARSIHCLQQVMKMNPFWHAAAGSASLFGSKPGTLDLGNNNAPDKGNDFAGNPNLSGRERGSQTATTSQPILIQQPLPPVPATNLLGPAFIFPLNQQQAAVAAASVRPSSTKSASVGGSTGTSDPSSSAEASASVAAAMSFNYPAMAANETQYLAILQNSGYSFPIPAVGAPPSYRANPALFNSSFYSSQMIHSPQLQHQQTLSIQSSQLQQAHSNTSSSQRHMVTHQQRPQSSGANGGAGTANSQEFPGPKSQPFQHPQQSNSPHLHSQRPRHFDGELGKEGSPSTTDSRGSRASVNIYGQNFAMPIHPHNFALFTPPAALAGASPASGSSDQSEKQQQQQSFAQHGFGMSFGTINGANAGPGIDIASMKQNHAFFQSFPEATRHNTQMMEATAAAAQAEQKKQFRVSEDDKSGGVGDSVTSDAGRKSSTTKAQGGAGQSIAFSRSDSANAPVSSAQASCVNVIESSGRSQNIASGTAHSSRPGSDSAVCATKMLSNHIQLQIQQQQLATPASNWSKAPGATNNGSLFSEHLSSSSIMAAKYSAGLPQNFVRSSTSPSQSPQWRSSTRMPSSQAPSAHASSGVATTKNLSQQHSRTPAQMQTQISFSGNQKPSSSQGQAPPSGNQAPSPVMVVSPTTSSISRGGSGSPRTTTSASANTKMVQNSSLSSQQPKNSPSILGQPHATSSSSSGTKHPQQKQFQPQQQPIQAQLFFSNSYSQAQSSHLASTSSATSSPGGFSMQRRRADQQQQPAQQSSVVPPTPSSGMLTMSPSAMLTSSSAAMNDPAKAVAVATANVKGGVIPSQGIINAGTLLPASFSYPHSVPAAVQVKPAEQKQPAG